MKILFVDVDGPLIPSTEFLLDKLCSFQRRLPKLQIALLNAICDRTGAKVVMNTTHNMMYPDIPNIRDAMVASGFNSDYFHTDRPSTQYPNGSRSNAVISWLSGFGSDVTDYVCIDDVMCAVPDHMELIDPDLGLQLSNVNRIIERFGGKPFIFLM